MRDSETLAFPQSPKNLGKVFKVELTGMLISLRCYRLNKLHRMRTVKKCWVWPGSGLALLDFHLHLFMILLCVS